MPCQVQRMDHPVHTGWQHFRWLFRLGAVVGTAGALPHRRRGGPPRSPQHRQIIAAKQIW